MRTDEVPEQLKILDRSRKNNASVPTAVDPRPSSAPTTVDPARIVAGAVSVSTQPVVQHQQIQAITKYMLHDYPSVRNWLETLHDDMERGRDGFNYRSLLPMFEHNDIKRLDDVNVLGYLSLSEIAKDVNIDASIGLLNCIIRYAQEDTSHIKMR